MSSKKPADSNSIPQQVRMSEELLARIDDARRKIPELPTRAEMIRRMVVDWLERNE